MTTRRDLLRAAGAVSLTALAGAASVTPARALDVDSSPRTVPVSPLRSAYSFVDSVATNAHWGYFDTQYNLAYPKVRDLLVASGIRHVRSLSTERAEELRQLGISSAVLVDSDMEGRGDPVQILQRLKPFVSSGAVVAAEGPNEPDLFWKQHGRTWKGQLFPEGPRLWQQDLWQTVRADPVLDKLKVIGMSFGETYWGGGHPYGPGSLADTCDWGNFHPYPSGNPYTDQYHYGGIQQYYADSTFPSAALDVHPLTFNTYRPPFNDKPMAATETGYSTWKWGQSEKTQGKYMPRMYAENFRLGIVRTYGYEFLDIFDEPAGEDRARHFGLVRNDLSPKPAYNAVRSMLKAVRAGRRDHAATRDFRAELTVVPAAGYDGVYLHHLALQREDGSVALVVWHEVSSEDQVGLDLTPKRPTRELSHPAVVVSLDLGRKVSGVTAQYIDDSGNLRPKALATSGTAVNFLVGDRLTIVDVPVP